MLARRLAHFLPLWDQLVVLSSLMVLQSHVKNFLNLTGNFISGALARDKSRILCDLDQLLKFQDQELKVWCLANDLSFIYLQLQKNTYYTKKMKTIYILLLRLQFCHRQSGEEAQQKLNSLQKIGLLILNYDIMSAVKSWSGEFNLQLSR